MKPEMIHIPAGEYFFTKASQSTLEQLAERLAKLQKAYYGELEVEADCD